jgi:hypothetical protein
MEPITGLTVNIDISKAFSILYGLLIKEKTIEAEEVLGHVSQAWAIWENEDN